MLMGLAGPFTALACDGLTKKLASLAHRPPELLLSVFHDYLKKSLPAKTLPILPTTTYAQVLQAYLRVGRSDDALRLVGMLERRGWLRDACLEVLMRELKAPHFTRPLTENLKTLTETPKQKEEETLGPFMLGQREIPSVVEALFRLQKRPSVESWRARLLAFCWPFYCRTPIIVDQAQNPESPQSSAFRAFLEKNSDLISRYKEAKDFHGSHPFCFEMLSRAIEKRVWAFVYYLLGDGLELLTQEQVRHLLSLSESFLPAKRIEKEIVGGVWEKDAGLALTDESSLVGLLAYKRLFFRGLKSLDQRTALLSLSYATRMGATLASDIALRSLKALDLDNQLIMELAKDCLERTLPYDFWDETEKTVIGQDSEALVDKLACDEGTITLLRQMVE